MREFGVLILIVTVLLSILFSIISLVDRMDELIPYGINADSLIKIGILKIPEYMRYLIPMATLICTILVISLASRRNEIVAIKASGMNLRRFFAPFIVAGVLLLIVDFFIAEVISPVSLRKLSEIVYTIKGERDFSYQRGTVWFRGEGGQIVRAGLFIPEKKEVYGITVFYIGEKGLIKRISAERGRWTEKYWKLYGVKVYEIEKGRVGKYPEIILEGVGKPDIFEKELSRREELSVLELIRYEKKLRRSGFRNIKMKVDIHSRISYPLTILFMVMVGIFLSLKSRSGRGIMSAGAGILISILYWIAYTMALSMGFAGVVSPPVAAWSVPLGSLAVGVYLYLKVPL